MRHSNAKAFDIMTPPSDKTNAITYKDAGVDIDAGAELVEEIKPLVRSTSRPGSDTEIGGFGGLFDLKAAGFSDPILVAANDGVGTKLKIAIDTGLHSTVGIDLVAMCVNDLIVQGAEPLFFLDYYATGKLTVSEGRSVVEGIAEGCKRAGAALIGGETAEMPGMYANGDYDLAGFAVGAAERGNLLPKDVSKGDVLLGLSSDGIHSNGYSLVRKLVDVSGLDYDYPAPFDPTRKLGEALLTPTRIYVKSLLAAIKSDTLKAMAHITGGGLTENLPRVLPADVQAKIDLNSWKLPPVFSWLRDTGGMNETELLRTFNCGVGMIVVVSKEKVNEATDILCDAGETVSIIGMLEERQAPDSEQVVYTNTLEDDK